MRVTRVALRAEVASFRHPFFVTGRQPSATFPPPSTVHGQCACALGEWPAPEDFFFGLHFTYQARAQDLEHQHLVQALGARARTTISGRAGVPEQRATTQGSIQPVPRDFLFGCALTLYLPHKVGAAFRSPAFVLTMGRSQDLAEVVAVDAIELERSARVRLEHTLLPRRLRPCLRFGTTVLLSRYVSPPPERQAEFAQYVGLHDAVYAGAGAEPNRALLDVPGVDLEDLWVDPTAPMDDDGFPRGVWLHRLRD